MESIEDLKKKCQGQKRSKIIPLTIGYMIHRDVSIYVTWFILRFFPKLSPLTVTIVLLIIGIIGVGFMFSSHLIGTLIGLVLIYVSFILDKVDGEIARYKESFSLQGMYLDEMYHILIPVGMFAGVFWNVPTGNIWSLTAFVVLLLLTILNRYNRKIPRSISVKLAGMYTEKKEKFYHVDAPGFVVFLNNPLIKVASIIERFDIILLLIIGVVVGEVLYPDFQILTWSLYLLAAVYLVYFVRWFFLLLFGGVQSEVEKIQKQ